MVNKQCDLPSIFQHKVLSYYWPFGFCLPGFCHPTTGEAHQSYARRTKQWGEVTAWSEDQRTDGRTGTEVTHSTHA